MHSAPYGYGRSVWRLDTMGFREARLARRQMGAHRGRYRELRNSAIFNGLGWRGTRMRNCALRDFRIQARQEKGESKTRESKGGKDKPRVSELNSRQKRGRPPERKARHMEHSDRGAYLAARGGGDRRTSRRAFSRDSRDILHSQ